MKASTSLASALAGAAMAQTFDNPILWNDLADPDVLRVGDEYFYTASNMHHSPGAPILRSYDLVNWEYYGHAIPRLEFGPEYDLTNGSRAYIQGTWASFLEYRESDSLFYWGGCISGGDTTYFYTASDAAGPWEQSSQIDKCYHDAGMLIDDDDSLWIAYGNTEISVAHITKDATEEIESKLVLETPEEIETLEGARFYKINGTYYIFLTKPPDGQYIIKSDNGPFGPYSEPHKIVQSVAAPVPGAGSPHQGGIVQLPSGEWYWLAFIDAYPGGRIPVLAPFIWDEDGWPSVPLTDDGDWPVTYPAPLPLRPLQTLTGDYDFGNGLDDRWEWNHNPDNDRWGTTENGLVLMTATVTDDLYQAQNTLTQRSLGPASNATIQMSLSAMQDGDHAGLALFRQNTSYVGVRKTGDEIEVVRLDNTTIDPDDDWATSSLGEEVASQPIDAGTSCIWLRIMADFRPDDKPTSGIGYFFYSLDGCNFMQLGSEGFVMETDWQFFIGYRYAVFNFATKALGGAVGVHNFNLEEV